LLSGLAAVGRAPADDVLAPGVENKGTVSSPEEIMALKDDESKPRSGPLLVMLWKAGIDWFGWDANAGFSTHGGVGVTSGGAEGSGEVAVATAPPKKRRTPCIVASQTEACLQGLETDGSRNE
jgi:hypothetical protein